MSIPANRPPEPEEILDTNTPAAARRYDYVLGGKDNVAADRASADVLSAELPQLAKAMRENRAFVIRAVRYLAGEVRVRQFLDIGCGLPTPENVHDVAQEIDPAARVVYVDNDPLVMVHAQALMTGNGVGAVGHAKADVRYPKTLLADPEVQRVLDFGRPVALLLCAVLHFITDDDEAQAVVGELVAALPSGSFVVISHATYDPLPADVADKIDELAASGAHGPFRARSKGRIGSYLDGLDLVEPGLTWTSRWQPDLTAEAASPWDALAYAAVARKP
jgi:hypothetical protein